MQSQNSSTNKREAISEEISERNILQDQTLADGEQKIICIEEQHLEETNKNKDTEVAERGDSNDNDDEEGEGDEAINEIENEQIKQQFQVELTHVLLEEVRTFNDLWIKLNDDFDTSPTLIYYLISMKWLQKWKRYVSYERLSKGKTPNYEHFGKFKEELLGGNNELIQFSLKSQRKDFFQIDSDDSELGASIVLQPNLKDSIDYTIINSDLISFFAKKYSNFLVIPRKAYFKSNNKKRIQVYYSQVQTYFSVYFNFQNKRRGNNNQENIKRIWLIEFKNDLNFAFLINNYFCIPYAINLQINMIILNLQTLKNIDQQQIKEFEVKKVQIFSGFTLTELREFLAPIIERNQLRPSSIRNGLDQISSQNIRLWQLRENQTIPQLFRELHNSTRNEKSFNYHFRTNLPIVDGPQQATISQLKIFDESTLIVEIQKQDNRWIFQSEAELDISNCSFCNKFVSLQFSCKCKQVKYCSVYCKENDILFHSKNCEYAEDFLFQDDKPFEFRPDSIRGLCGLKNLGNTCFINSALQCLSNTTPLTNYFLNKTYIQELNFENVLGSKGIFAQKFGQFIQQAWTGLPSCFSPDSIYQVLKNKSSIFADFQQHDSQEFLSYLLDQLHEDLNRVKNKQQAQEIDSLPKQDAELEKQFWENSLKSDNSIITDLAKGLYKSKISCPTCQNVSIMFEPFLSVSLPIPYKKMKQIQVCLIFSNNRELSKKVNFNYDALEQLTVIDFKKHCSGLYNVEISNLELLYLTQEKIQFQFSSKSILLKRTTEQKNIFEDSTPLEEFRKSMKIFKKSGVMIEHQYNTQNKICLENDFIQTPNMIRIFVQFSKLKQTRSLLLSTQAVQSITFVRPFLVPYESTVQEIRKSIFYYLLPLFKRTCDINSEFWKDIQSYSDDDIFEKYYLQQVNQPFSVEIETDCQPYLKRPCSWCKSDKCKNCKLTILSHQTIGEIQSASKNSFHIFKLICLINENSPLGKLIPNLNALDEKDEIGQTQLTQNTEKNITLYECLDLFEQPEVLSSENMWFCEFCKEHLQATKQIQIQRAPQILMFHLKRFKGKKGSFKQKLQTLVEFPIENLDISKYISKDYPIIYDLYSVNNHYGNIGFGHYTSFAENNGNWYEFDDQKVGQIDRGKIVSEASYILFYRKRQ